MAAFPTSVATDSDLYIAVNAVSTQLTDNPLSAGATTVNVTSTAAFPTVGFISIDNEIIKYTGKTGTSFTGCTRAADGTSATSHVQNSQVFHNVIAIHHNALKDDLIAVESYLSTHLGLATTVTSTEFGYLSGVTSAIQTQLNTKATDSLVVHLAGAETITGAKTFQDQRLILQETAGTDTITITVASLATSRTYTVPDAGANASFVMTEGSQTINGAKTFTSPILSTDPTVNSITAQASVNGTNPRVRAVNTNGTSGQNRSAIVGAAGDNGNVEVSLIAGKDSSNNNVEMCSGTSKLSLGFGGIEYLRVVSAGLTFADTSVQGIVGTTTNNNAATGNVGQYIESTSTTAINAAATGQFKDFVSMSLTAGDWDVTGLLRMSVNSATATVIGAAISVNSNNSTGDHVDEQNTINNSFSLGATDSRDLIIPNYRLSLSATTTVYLKGRFDFSAGTPQLAKGRLSARRVR